MSDKIGISDTKSLFNVKNQKRYEYRQLDVERKRYEKRFLNISFEKPTIKYEVPLSLFFMDNLMEGVRRFFRSKEDKSNIDEQRTGKFKAVQKFNKCYKHIICIHSAIESYHVSNRFIRIKGQLQGKELMIELKSRIDAIDSSLNELENLFLDKDNRTNAYKQEITDFANTNLPNLRVMKEEMEQTSKTEKGKELGIQGKKASRAMGTLCKYAEDTLSSVFHGTDNPKTLGDLENSLKYLSKELYKSVIENANKFHQELQDNNWNKNDISRITEDPSYSKYAMDCFRQFAVQLEKCNSLVDDKTIAKQLFTDFKDLFVYYNKANTIKNVINLAIARKNFREKRDIESSTNVRKALEHFNPTEDLIAYHRKYSMHYWIKQSIINADDKLMEDTILNISKKYIAKNQTKEASTSKLSPKSNKIGIGDHIPNG